MFSAHNYKSLVFVIFKVPLMMVVAMLVTSVQANSGPIPPPPEGTYMIVTVDIYNPAGTLVDSVNLLETDTYLASFFFGDDLSYSSILGDSTYFNMQVLYPSIDGETTEFDFFDGDITNGITTPFSLDIGGSQRAIQYSWELNGETQIVISLLDASNISGLWMFSTADTDPTDNVPGTVFLDGPLTGYSVDWNMVWTIPIPAGLWLFLSALLPFALGAKKRIFTT